MSNKLVEPHGGSGLSISVLTGEALDCEQKRARSLPKVHISHRAMGDLLMICTGAFSPLRGFMTKEDWKSVCGEMLLTDGCFWPIPVTLDIAEAEFGSVSVGDEVALIPPGTEEAAAEMTITEKFVLDSSEKGYECECVFRGHGKDSLTGFRENALERHPGVKMVLQQHDHYLAGPIRLLNSGDVMSGRPDLFLTPQQTRTIFTERNWSNVAALQLRNPMHRSHEYLCKTALEVCDGVLIHSLAGRLKPGDIPANVRIRCIDKLIEKYFVPRNVIHAAYPLDMRYAGPREALLHAVFRQNHGCSKMIIGRDHAGVGKFYTEYEAQEIFDRIPTPKKEGYALKCTPLKIDMAFYCTKCDGMATSRTCPHEEQFQITISGTRVREILSGGGSVSPKLIRPEIAEILEKYYQNENLGA